MAQQPQRTRPFTSNAEDWEVVDESDYEAVEEPSPGMSGVARGHGKTFMDGPFKGQTWAVADDGSLYQVQSGSDLTRPDNSILGIPPELAVTAPLQIGRAVAESGLSATGRAVAGAKAAVGQAAPALKYEATKSALQAVGIPSAVATTLALMVSGYSPTKGRAPRAPRRTAAAPTAEPTPTPAPAATPPVAPARPAAASANTTAPASSAGSKWSPQRIRNEVGLAARREKLPLSEAQYKQADDLVRQGMAPREAVKQAVSGATQKAKMTAAESQAYLRLRRAGKTHDEAVASVEQQRELASRLGTPSSEEVRKRVAERNATGRWPNP